MAQAGPATAPRRILIFSATVGEGHESAARALAADLGAEAPGTEVIVTDAIEAFGPFLRFFVRDVYKFLLRRAPWGYGAAYTVLTRVAVARAFGLLGLRMLGGRRLRRLIERTGATLVVSTFPGVTSILGHGRLHGRIRVPVVATVTDLAGMVHWAHRGIDLHLVLHDRCAEEVERMAGRGAARRVQPLVDPAFLDPPSRAEARAALELPADGPVVVVSGGGWGAGDVEGALEAALALPDVVVMAVAGRNEALRERLERRAADEPRLRVLGFTRRMPELLAAADALVHTTGGVTCMEAIVVGCPLVTYGEPPGHARLNDRFLLAEDLAAGARDRAELERVIGSIIAGDRRPAPPPGPAPAAASVLARAVPRVRPVPLWRRGLAPVATGVAASSVIAFIATSTAAYSILSTPLHVAPMTRVAMAVPEVGLVLRVPRAAAPAVEAELGRVGAHASFARVPADGTAPAFLRPGDEPLCSVVGGQVDWIEARNQLRQEARAMRVGGRYRYLASTRLTLGEAITLRLAGGQPVAGAVELRAPLGKARPRVRAGDVVVLTLGPSPVEGARAVHQLLDDLGDAGLSATSLSGLLADARTPARAGEASSTIAPTTTTSNETTSTAPLPPPGQVSPNSAGASATGTSVPAAKTTAATGAAARRWTALISLRMPTAAAPTTPTSQSTVATGRPA